MLLLTFSKTGQEDIILTEDDLFDFDYEENAYSGETFELGSVCAKSIYMMIDNNAQRFSRGIFANTRIKLEIDGNFYGYFNAELPKRRNGVIELNAYDDMVKLDVAFPSDVLFPALFKQAYAYCTIAAGLAQEFSYDNVVLNGVWDNGVITYEYNDYIYANSCRNLVSGMAEWNGGFAHINSDGKLQVDKFSKTVSREYNSGDLFEFDYSDDTVIFTKVKTSQKNKTYEKGDDSGYTLVLNNQYISYGLDDEAFETYLTLIYDYYNGFSLTPMSFVLAEPDFQLHVGDRIQVYDEEEQITITGNVSKIEISGNCSMKVTCGGFENVSSSSNFTPTSYNQIAQSKTEAVQNAVSTSTAPLNQYEYLTDLSAKLNGVTYTVEKDADTGLISKISDSNGNEFEPTINSGISDTAFHNAVIMAVAIVKGFGKTIEPTGIYAEYVPSGIDVANMLWHDYAGSNDMTLYGSPASASGGLKLSGNSNYGKAALDEPHTVYAIFKGCRSTHTWTPVICKGTNNDTGYTCFDVFLNNGYILGTSNGGNLVSNETPADWHVVCITRSDSGNPKMYIDGTLVGEFTANYGANYAGYYTINNAYRGGMFNNAGEFVFKYLSFGSQEHTAGQVAQISQSLMSKYLYKSMCHKNYRDFQMCTSVSMSWEIPKSGLALLIVVHRYDITSISDSNWTLLHKSPAASPDQSYHQWISVYQYNGAMQAGKEYTISVTQSSSQRLWLGLYIFENAKSFAIIDSAVASSSPITPTATSGNERLYVVTNTMVNTSSDISPAVEAIDCDNLDFAYPIDRRLLVAYDYQPELGITPRFSYFNGEDDCTNYVTIDIII